MELDFGQEAYGTHFDGFMRHYLTVKTGEIPRLDEVYEPSRATLGRQMTATAGIEAWSGNSRLCALLLRNGAWATNPMLS